MKNKAAKLMLAASLFLLADESWSHGGSGSISCEEAAEFLEEPVENPTRQHLVNWMSGFAQGVIFAAPEKFENQFSASFVLYHLPDLLLKECQSRPNQRVIDAIRKVANDW